MLCHVPPERQKQEEEQGPAEIKSNTKWLLLTKELLLLDFCRGRRADMIQPKKRVCTAPFQVL